MTDAVALTLRLQRFGVRPPGRPAPAADAKLAELVARIARLKGRAHPPRAATSEAGLAATLGGEILTPGLILIKRSVPLWHRVGRVPLASLLQARGKPFPDDPGECVFLDTETTGLAGGSGTVAFMVGLGRLSPTRSQFDIRQYVIATFGAERAMLEVLAEEAGGGDCLVTFNGKSYDLPLLATRYTLLGKANPLTALAHIDLRYPLRRVYAARFADCRLKTLEERALGHRRSNDLPGSEAPKAWLDWLRCRETAMLTEVARHNRADILAMVALCQCLHGGELVGC